MGNGGTIRGFAVNDFVAHISATSDQAYAVISVDPSSDDPQLIVECLGPILGASVATMIASYCGAIVSFPSLAEAHACLVAVEKEIPKLRGHGLIGMLYVSGHSFMTIREPNADDPEINLASHQSVM